MAKNQAKRANEFTKRANELLSQRMAPVEQLGELLAAEAEKQAELDALRGDIDKAVQACLEVGWKPAELSELGVPKSALSRRKGRASGMELHRIEPIADSHTPAEESPQ